MKSLDGYRVNIISKRQNKEFIDIPFLGLAGIQSDVSELFLEHHINGAALSTLLRDDLIRMGITKLDQQLILMQSIDLLLTLVKQNKTFKFKKSNQSFCLGQPFK